MPVPAIKGGAVENLLQTFLEINEKTNEFQFIVFTINHPQASVLSKSFINTKFISIEVTLLYRISRAIRFIINKLNSYTTSNQFIYEVLKYKKVFLEADMILIENNPGFSTYVRKATSKPIALHLHNDYLNIDNKKLSRKFLNNLNFVVGVSDYIKDRVEQIATDNIRVERVYNGMNLTRFMNYDLINERKTLKQKYSINDGDLVILFTGRITESKGIKLLMEAFIDLSQKHNIKLLIVGSSGFGGSKKNNFIKQLEILSMVAANKIIFTGYIEYSEIHHIYNLADFAVFPSLSPEAFALTTIEALASGLPVIITDAGGMPEAINAKCGIIINRGTEIKKDLLKHMERLITDYELRNEMSTEATRHVQKFNDLTYYQNLSRVLKSFT